MNTFDIIGMGQNKNDLTQTHLDIIKRCDVMIAGRRHLDMFDLPEIQKIPITSSIKNIIDTIKEKIKINKIVVLASGDPLLHGIGSTLIRHFDKKQINIHSNISSVSAAFAAIKEPWHNTRIISLHGKQTRQSFCFSELVKENKVAFLTDPQNNPQYIAAQLQKLNQINFKFCVLENLGDKKKEKISWFENYESIAAQKFSQPNIVILKKIVKEKNDFSHEKIHQDTYIGMIDSEFRHSKGLITKSEVRCISLSKLKLIKKNHLLWDIGSGSGSLGIEAALQLQNGKVYAIEKKIDRISDIAYNIKKFNCSNIKVVNKNFPDGVDEIKNTPDRIFIGGGGKNLKEIIKTCCEKIAPSGVIVINSVVVQNFQTALNLLKELNFNPEVVQVQISRLKAMPFGDRLEALNPVWIISGTKPGKEN
jgi:precorrin-6B C5,15-methyltransferase / cobalt-precorrin-6B C5,C15-methyltransferase